MTKYDSGFSLIEVLVTLVIVSIGLLGLAALQSTSLTYNLSAYHRTQATVLTNSIMDRMRSNRIAANTQQYNTTNSNAASDYTANCYGTVAHCNASNLANHDLRVWKTALEELLPNGQGNITNTIATGTGIMHHITVSWIDDKTADVSDTTDSRKISITIDGEL